MRTAGHPTAAPDSPTVTTATADTNINHAAAETRMAPAMAAVSSSVIGGPITAIVLIFELTGSYNYAIASILPVALSNLTTYLTFGSSFFDAQLKLRKIPMGHGREHILLSQTSIEKYIDNHAYFT